MTPSSSRSPRPSRSSTCRAIGCSCESLLTVRTCLAGRGAARAGTKPKAEAYNRCELTEAPHAVDWGNHTGKFLLLSALRCTLRGDLCAACRGRAEHGEMRGLRTRDGRVAIGVGANLQARAPTGRCLARDVLPKLATSPKVRLVPLAVVAPISRSPPF